MHKIAIPISDILDDSRPNSIRVEIADTGKAAWLPRMINGYAIEFWPGRVVLPLWLGRRILRNGFDSENPDFSHSRRG